MQMGDSPAKTTLIGSVLYHIWTLFLFTKSDIKTTVVPCTVFGAVIAPLRSMSGLPHVVLWVWMQILAFDISSQAISIEEDRENKPYRPLPSGRISIEDAQWLRRIVLIIAFVHSAFYGANTICAAVGMFVVNHVLYCDLRCDASHWDIRNFIGAVDLLPLLLGATIVAGSSPELDGIDLKAFILSFAITLTTFHCQDFKDIAGDIKVGRNTFPMAHPTMSRVAYMVSIVLWSVVVSVVWELETRLAGILVAFGVILGTAVMLFRTVEADQMSYLLFQIWQTTVFLIPGYYRYKYAGLVSE